MPPGVWVWDRGRGGPAPKTVARDHDHNRGKRAPLRWSSLPRLSEWSRAWLLLTREEQDRPVILEAGDGVTEVSFQDATYAVSDHDLAEAAAARLGPESGLPAEVRAALRCFA